MTFFNHVFNPILWGFFFRQWFHFDFVCQTRKKYCLNSGFSFFYHFLCFVYIVASEQNSNFFLIPSLFYNLSKLSVVIFMYLLLRGTIRTFCKRVKDFLLDCTALCSTWCFSQRYTYKVLQTIQMKPILLCVWAEPAVLGSTKTALKFKYKI